MALFLFLLVSMCWQITERLPFQSLCQLTNAPLLLKCNLMYIIHINVIRTESSDTKDNKGSKLNSAYPPKINPDPNLWNLWVVPCTVKYVIKLKVLKRTYPRLSWSALNSVGGVLIRVRQGNIWEREEEEVMWSWRQILELHGHRSRNTDSHRKLDTEQTLL